MHFRFHKKEKNKIMSQLQENHYKEVDPLETVVLLRNILQKLEIQVNEKWISEEKATCHCIHLEIPNTNIGSNGKGVTREYALASAYAEFFERMQNSILASPQKFDIQSKNGGEYIDEEQLTADEIIAQGGGFLHFLLEHLNFCHDDLEFCALQFKMHYRGHGKDGSYFCRPFYSLKDKKVYLLPREVYYPYYRSNGMCAGNSLEEAMVQGISEIIEFYVEKLILEEELALPDIPFEYVKQFPSCFALYQTLLDQKMEGYHYILKDASLGGKYPVVVFIAINQKKGAYGISFGSHPDHGIAIERALIRAFQKQDIKKFANRDLLDFDKNRKIFNDTIYSTYNKESSLYPIKMLITPSNFEFTPFPMLKVMDNKELLKHLLLSLLKDGKDVLVRDVSYLGLPSCHIIIPGMSEILPVDDVTAGVINSIEPVVDIMRRLGKASRQELKLTRMYQDYITYSQYDNTLTAQYGVPLHYPFPGNQYSYGSLYLSAMISYKLGDINLAVDRISEFNQINLANEIKDPQFYKCIEIYFRGKQQGYTHENIMELLTQFFQEDIYQQIEDILKDPEEILALQYPIINPYQCSDCEIIEYCRYDIVKKLQATLLELQREYFPSQEDLERFTVEF